METTVLHNGNSSSLAITKDCEICDNEFTQPVSTMYQNDTKCICDDCRAALKKLIGK